jgi:hypothetical protein
MGFFLVLAAVLGFSPATLDATRSRLIGCCAHACENVCAGVNAGVYGGQAFPGLMACLEAATQKLCTQWQIVCRHGACLGRSTSQAISRMLPVLTTVKIQSA